MGELAGIGRGSGADFDFLGAQGKSKEGSRGQESLVLRNLGGRLDDRRYVRIREGCGNCFGCRGCGLGRGGSGSRLGGSGWRRGGLGACGHGAGRHQQNKKCVLHRVFKLRVVLVGSVSGAPALAHRRSRKVPPALTGEADRAPLQSASILHAPTGGVLSLPLDLPPGSMRRLHWLRWRRGRRGRH